MSSAQLAGRCRELGQPLYTDCRAIADWLAITYGVHYSISGLTDLLHRLGYSYKRTTAVPCQADAAAQTAFLTQTPAPLLTQAEAEEAVVYFADAAHPTHNTRATHVWTATGKEMRSEEVEKKPRKSQIGVEVTAEEKAVISQVAKYKGMKAATLLRALALQEARNLGFLKDQFATPKNSAYLVELSGCVY